MMQHARWHESVLREKEFLDQIAAHPIDSDLTKDLVKRLPPAYFANAIVGEIRWPKWMPTISAPNRGDYFTLKLTYWTEKLDRRTGGAEKIFTQLLPFMTKNGPDDDEYFRVSFMATRQQTHYEMTLEITPNDEALWRPEPSFRRHVVAPASRAFTADKTGPLLDPFDVEVRFRFKRRFNRDIRARSAA